MHSFIELSVAKFEVVCWSCGGQRLYSVRYLKTKLN